MTLGFTVLQVNRLKIKYKMGGAAGISHKNRVRNPAHALSYEAERRSRRIIHIHSIKTTTTVTLTSTLGTQ